MTMIKGMKAADFHDAIKIITRCLSETDDKTKLLVALGAAQSDGEHYFAMGDSQEYFDVYIREGQHLRHQFGFAANDTGGVLDGVNRLACLLADIGESQVRMGAVEGTEEGV